MNLARFRAGATRTRGALRILGVAALVRAGLALVTAASPAAWVGRATQHFPRGELALLDAGGVLGFEFARGSAPPPALPAVFLALGLLAVVASAVLHAVAVARLAQPDEPFAAVLRAATRRLGTTLLFTALGDALLAATLFASATLGELLYGVLGPSIVRWVLFAIGASLPLLLLAIVLDSARVAATCEDVGFFDALMSATRSLRRHLPTLLASYVLTSLVSVVTTLAGAALTLRLALGSTPLSVAGAVICSLALLAWVPVLRGFWLAMLVECGHSLREGQEIG
ncbi:MAG: hypothetical protein U0271_26305 [Polyangiaceae bacterium]